MATLSPEFFSQDTILASLVVCPKSGRMMTCFIQFRQVDPDVIIDPAVAHESHLHSLKWLQPEFEGFDLIGAQVELKRVT